MTENDRTLVRIFDRLRHAEVETFPDGRPAMFQSLRLLRTFTVLREYFRENAPS